MKRGATDHPKMLALAQALSGPVYVAVGVVECLIHWTAKYAPRGNVGKWNDDVIARGIGWQGEATVFVDALVFSGWLDADPEHRLIVHDWSEHADDAVQRHLARAGELFADGTPPSTARLDGREKAEADKALAKARRGRTSGARMAHAGRSAGALPEPSPAPPEPPPASALPEPEPEPEEKIPPAASRPRPVVDGVGLSRSPGALTWDAYAAAFEARYHTSPTRNAKVNSILARFVLRVPGDEAPAIAAFYVQHPDALYGRSLHCVDLMLRDAEKLRTEWKTGRQVNGTDARRNERTASNPFAKLANEQNRMRVVS